MAVWQAATASVQEVTASLEKFWEGSTKPRSRWGSRRTVKHEDRPSFSHIEDQVHTKLPVAATALAAGRSRSMGESQGHSVGVDMPSATRCNLRACARKAGAGRSRRAEHGGGHPERVANGSGSESSGETTCANVLGKLGRWRRVVELSRMSEA